MNRVNNGERERKAAGLLVFDIWCLYWMIKIEIVVELLSGRRHKQFDI